MLIQAVQRICFRPYWRAGFCVYSGQVFQSRCSTVRLGFVGYTVASSMIYPEPKHFANAYLMRNINHQQAMYFGYGGSPIAAVNS